MQRKLVGLTLLMALLVGTLPVAGCGGSDAGGEGDAGGDWNYTDGSGKTVELDSRPERIIAHGHAAAALVSFGIRPVGIYTDTPVEEDPGLKDLDLEGIEILGENWGEVDVEKAAALDPDLIVADWWPVDNAYSGVEDGVKEESKKIAELAPMAGASQGGTAIDLIEGYEKLAETLGGDPDSDQVSAGKRRFEDAVSAFEETTEAKPGLTALAVSPSTDLLYVAVPEHAPELLDLRRWGLNVIVPDSPDKAFPYWENLSWENADKYQPDLLLVDDRTYPQNLRQAERQPTWRSIRAAAAGAVAPWPGYWVHTYDDFAEQLEALTAVIDKADANIGS
jgi:iron complex transport system substrate-binding protein